MVLPGMTDAVDPYVERKVWMMQEGQNFTTANHTLSKTLPTTANHTLSETSNQFSLRSRQTKQSIGLALTLV
jgi:hypothetical protein